MESNIKTILMKLKKGTIRVGKKKLIEFQSMYYLTEVSSALQNDDN